MLDNHSSHFDQVEATRTPLLPPAGSDEAPFDFERELRKSDSGLKNCRLPSDLVFSGMKQNAVIRLERSGNNMQTDAGAVDA